MEFRKLPADTVVDSLENYHKLTRSQYLYSMIHPDYAVTEGIQAKLYSDVPVPTSSIGIRTMYQLETSQNGTFLLSWSPNFIGTEQDIGARFANQSKYSDISEVAYSNILFCNSEGLNGTTTQITRNQALPGFIPSVMLQKYRLVSAIIKVKYNGSVLNQAGTMVSSATFDSLPVHNYAQVDASYPISNLLTVNTPLDDIFSRYGNFDIIRNGLWNYSTNITADANGIECLYVPTDPTANIFYDLSSYYGSTLSKTITITQTSNDVGYVESIVGDFGSQLSYVIAGYNLPSKTKCIQVEVFSNFEVIADPTVAPLLRSSMNTFFDWNDKRRMEELFKDLSKTGFIRRAWDKVKEGFPAFAKATLTWGPRLLPIINKLI